MNKVLCYVNLTHLDTTEPLLIVISYKVSLGGWIGEGVKRYMHASKLCLGSLNIIKYRTALLTVGVR